ncbi:MAG TPA: DUF3149 domain-containing protein [Methylophilus sp.]|nr:DUF3149 domain-containing protein [Methylophilus sp.]HQQ32483.1 DUF3149 domain-containing protein [Methylophilus sp.]
MKLLSDLFGTDYGLLSIIVIAAAAITMVGLVFVAISKIKETSPK